MGGGGSSSHSSGGGITIESSLAKTQSKILKNREQLFQDWYLPTFQTVMDEFNPNSASGKAAMNLTAQGINSSFDSAQKQTMQSLAQQNLLGSGASAALTAANQRDRASALANAYANQMANSTANKAQMLNSMATLMPSTSTAAPTLSFSRQHSESTSAQAGL
jgi:hypothetical protein